MRLLVLALVLEFLAVAAVAFLGALIGLPLAAARLRRTARIAVRPALEPTTEEDLAAPLKAFIGRTAPALVSLGFKPVASVHAPRFGTVLRWTQVLFVEPTEGNRASIICTQEGGVCFIRLAIATEFEDGTRILTPSGRGLSAQVDVADQVARHRKAVAELGRPPGGRLVPSEGDEIAWMSSRVARVAESAARRSGYRIAPGGEWYMLTWRGAVRILFRRIKNRLRPFSTRTGPHSNGPAETSL